MGFASRRNACTVSAVLVVAAVLGAIDSGNAHVALSPGCGDPGAAWAYADHVKSALSSGRDAWGERLLASANGPTYRAASAYLPPLMFATQRGRRPLTHSGVYYLPLSYPINVPMSTAFALHVADGSEILTRHVGGAALTLEVGSDGNERYGSCLGRLTAATLADGYLPIVRTAYVDANGVRYAQESLATRIPGARSIVSVLKLKVDTRRARHAAVVRFAASAPHRLVTDMRITTIPRGRQTTLYALWLHQPPATGRLRANSSTYDAARARVVSYWRRRLGTGTSVQLSEPRIANAANGLLIRQLQQGWHYSVGNPYEELSFAEALDTAEVMAEFGQLTDAERIVEAAIPRLPLRFSSWRAGEVLAAAGTLFALSRDRAFLAKITPALERAVNGLERREVTDGRPTGPLTPEPLCSDVPDIVDSVPAAAVASEGLQSIARAWAAAGRNADARRARALGLRLGRALRSAVARSSTHLTDGSLYVPARLDGDTGPYDRLTTSRDGSYWNLVMPYVFASGVLPTADTHGIVEYLLRHGSRLLGVPRADAHIVYGREIIGDGVNPVYGLAAARFFADAGLGDQLVLSMYGMLAAGMTRGTYISGEAVSVLPVDGRFYRTTYMPPNLGASSAFLETLYVMLVHEERAIGGSARALDLALATPRPWLRDGGRIAVTNARTSLGGLSYSIVRHHRTITIHVLRPPRPAEIRVHLRLPRGTHVTALRSATRAARLDRRTATVTLPPGPGPVTVEATLSA